jgi:catechol 2,3-dioxygenase-like lactoylglutathione lyase family enzyme
MLGDSEVHADVAVSDLGAAHKFYEATLGLKEIKQRDNEIYYKSGSGKIKIYQSQYAGTNQATYASWKVDDVQATVDGLKAKGVTFEHYDMPGVTREGDIHVMGSMRAAWFKDPDGNIFCISNED